ncbi:MAG: hypothetical protein WC758_08500 [Candidatus Woesearchaeota archaeon]|jgi:hypothetical protein
MKRHNIHGRGRHKLRIKYLQRKERKKQMGLKLEEPKIFKNKKDFLKKRK